MILPTALSFPLPTAAADMTKAVRNEWRQLAYEPTIGDHANPEKTWKGKHMSNRKYVVVWRTSTHVDYELYDNERDARSDEHMREGALYTIANSTGFGGAEAKEIYYHGHEQMAPAWGITEIIV